MRSADKPMRYNVGMKEAAFAWDHEEDIPVEVIFKVCLRPEFFRRLRDSRIFHAKVRVACCAIMGSSLDLDHRADRRGEARNKARQLSGWFFVCLFFMQLMLIPSHFAIKKKITLVDCKIWIYEVREKLGSHCYNSR